LTNYLTQSWGRFALCFSVLCLLAVYAQGARPLGVLYVYDDSAPRPFAGKVEPLLERAAHTLGEKLGGGIVFDVVEVMSAGEFFASYLDKFTYKELYTKVGYPVFGRVDRDLYRESVAAFLGQWELEELRSFFPEAPEDADVAWFVQGTLDAYAARIQALKEIKLADGTPWLTKKSYANSSYLAWAAAASAQRKWELVITNAPIVYDHITRPYPHNVMKKAILGGVSLAGQVKGSALNRVILLSLASVAEGTPSFLEDSLNGRSREERMLVAADYLLAHELGHAIYLIPDVYDHGPDCLMNTTMVNMDYWTGYQALNDSTDRCGKCAPYRRGKEKLAAGDRHYANKNYEKALKDFREAEELLPEWIAGDRQVVLVRLRLKHLKCLVFLGKRRESLALIEELIELDPENREFRKLRYSIKDMKKDVWIIPEDQREGGDDNNFLETEGGRSLP
jgi:tetratricopeptide (TPR) repeat protein